MGRDISGRRCNQREFYEAPAESSLATCDPPPMMDAAEKYLAAQGIPVWNRSVGRFDFV